MPPIARRSKAADFRDGEMRQATRRLPRGIVIAATPTTTQASPIQAVGAGFRRGRPRRARRRSAPANRPAPWCRPSPASGSGGNRSRRRPPSRTPQGPSSASIELADGASVQGCSTTRLSGIRIAAPAEQRARGRRHRIEALEAAAEDRAHRRSRWWRRRSRSPRRARWPMPPKRLDADDQADAGHARDHAEQFSRRRRLVAGDRRREQEGEDRRGRIEDGGQPRHRPSARPRRSASRGSRC